MNGEIPIRLILVRHGNTFEEGETPIQVGARTDLSLTQHGRNQALAFARHISSQKIRLRAIYAGILKRQIETAEILARELCLENQIEPIEPALTEIDYGPWEGLTTEEIIRRWPDDYRVWTERSRWPKIFGGSEQGHLQEIKRWLDQLRHLYKKGETILGVTSNGIIRFFHSLQEANRQSFKDRHPSVDLKVKTGHFCELWLSKDGFEVKQWNVKPDDQSTHPPFENV